jgi:hypothetical protein
MTTTIPSAALMPAAPVISNAERLALAGFLARYSGLTRAAYEPGLRQYVSWCHQNHLRLPRPAARTSSTSPVTSKPVAAPEPSVRDGFAPSPGTGRSAWATSLLITALATRRRNA